MPAGQPTKYRPEMCDRVVEMMSCGMSRYEVAFKLGITYQSLLNYEKEHSEFFEALKRGEDHSRGWWESEGRESLRDKDFNAGLWFMNMKNRHGWRDKVEQSGDPERPLKVDVEVTERPKLSKEEWLAAHSLGSTTRPPK